MPEVNIDGEELVTNWFGRWPSFHDAEIISIGFERSASEGIAVIAVKLHAFQMTSEVNEQGYFKLIKHCVIDFRFENVDEVVLEGFNHQNAIYGLRLETETGAGGQSLIRVGFEPANGTELEFICQRVTVNGLTPGAPTDGMYSAG